MIQHAAGLRRRTALRDGHSRPGGRLCAAEAREDEREYRRCDENRGGKAPAYCRQSLDAHGFMLTQLRAAVESRLGDGHQNFNLTPPTKARGVAGITLIELDRTDDGCCTIVPEISESLTTAAEVK